MKSFVASTGRTPSTANGNWLLRILLDITDCTTTPNESHTTSSVVKSILVATSYYDSLTNPLSSLDDMINVKEIRHEYLLQ